MDAQIKEVLYLANPEAGEAGILSKKISFSAEQQEKQKKLRELWEEATEKIGAFIPNLVKFELLSPCSEDDMNQWNQLHELINKQFHEINRYSLSILHGLNFYPAKLTSLIRSNGQNKKPTPSTQPSPPKPEEEKKEWLV